VAAATQLARAPRSDRSDENVPMRRSTHSRTSSEEANDGQQAPPAMAHGAHRTATLTIRGPLRRSDLPGLFARTCSLLAAGPVVLLRCEVAGVPADAVAVDALARLALAARRHGCATLLCGASEELLALVALIGLAEVLREEASPPAAAEDRTAERSCRSRGRT